MSQPVHLEQTATLALAVVTHPQWCDLHQCSFTPILPMVILCQIRASYTGLGLQSMPTSKDQLH